MKTSLCIFILAIIYFSACSSTYRLKEGDLSINEFNEELREKTVTIYLTNGQKHDAHNVSVNDQLIYWIDKQSGATQAIPTNQVDHILDKHHGQGALDGLGSGFLGGFAFGAIIGIAATDPDHKTSGFVDLTPRNYAEGAFGYGIGFAIPTALIGLPIGALAGHKDIYIIEKQKSKRKKPEYVKIKIESIVEENNAYITVQRSGANIKIARSAIRQIDKNGEDIYITISKEIYKMKFK